MALLKNKLSLASLALLAWLLSACSKSDTWEEDVELVKGKVISITRTQYYERYSELGAPGDGWRPVKSRIEFVQDKASPETIVWEEELDPLVLELINDHLVLVAKASYCDQYHRYGRPIPPYVIYRFANGRWDRSGFADLPAKLQANLLIDAKSKSSRRRVTIDFKKQMNDELGIPKFLKQIDPSYRMVC
jgi:hypothetical protein